MNFYKHHIGDYDAATAHLDWLEDMAYTRLMRVYYRNERPLPAKKEEVYRLIRATKKQEKVAGAKVLKEYFELRSDGWHNKRCDQEILAYQAQVATNRTIARQRTVQRTVERIVNESSTNRVPNQNQIPEPDTRTVHTHVPSSTVPTVKNTGVACVSFSQFWENYPRKAAKQAALTAWRNLDPPPELMPRILEALEAQKASPQWRERGAIPNASTWLTGRRWEDEPDASSDQASGQCAWNINGNREGEPRCDKPATTMKNGTAYCAAHSQRVNAWG